MKMKSLVTVAVSLFLLCGCSSFHTGSGTLQPVNTVCQAGNATNTPPQLYAMMVDCVQQQNYAQASSLYAMAGSYSSYDALRAGTPLAREQHSRLLAETLAQLEPEQRDTFWEVLRSVLENKGALASVCKDVLQTGVPDYTQNYMNDPQWAVSAKPDSKLWEQAVTHYLHCK